MIESLHGELVSKSPAAAVVRVAGVAFRLSIPLSTYEVLPHEGAHTALLTHLHVREDDLSLYGFATAEERELFRMLLSVSQVGPAVALRVLSSCTASQFKGFILDEDAESLAALVKGIGPKMARRLIVELQGPVRDLAVAPAGPATSRAARDAIQALVALGESRQSAHKAVLAALAELGDDADEQRLVQEVLSRG